MRGIHRERESFRFRKRRTTAAAKAMMKMQQQQQNLECLNDVQQEGEEDEEISVYPEPDEFEEEDNGGNAEESLDIAEIDDYTNPELVATEAKEVASLYRRSMLSKPQAIQMLQLFRIRHRLTDACFDDLLQMLHRTFLPEENTLPRTLRSFAKALDEDCVLQVVQSNQNYVVFDVASQINDVVTRNYSSFLKHRLWIQQHEDKFDYCGHALRKSMDEFISISVFTDGAGVGKSTTVQLWPLIGFVLDLSPKLQKSIENVIWIGIFVGQKSPNWIEFFEQITPQFVELKINPMNLHFEPHNAPVAVAVPQYKVRILEILADNIGRADILLMKKPPAKNCCPLCTIKGNWEPAAKSLVYPERAIHSRNTWLPDPPDGISNGIKGLSPLAHIVGVHEMLKIVQTDCMHTVYGGIFRRMMDTMYNKINRTATEYFDNLAMIFYRPREIRRKPRPFKQMARFKMNEFRTILHFAVAVIMPGFADLGLQKRESRMAVNCLLLAAGMHVLASKNLTIENIDFANKIFKHWHKTLPRSFGKDFHTFKAHQILHLAELSRTHGSCAHRTCFTESVVGYALARISSQKDALMQIANRIKRIPSSSLDLSTKAWFSTTEFVETDQFKIWPWEMKQGDNQTAIKQFFSSRYPNQLVALSRKHKMDHVVINSRALHSNFTDSIIFIESMNDQSLRPAIAEVFFKIGDEIRVLVREINVVTSLAQSLRWIQDDEVAHRLLTDRRTFAGCFVVEPEYGHLYAFRLKRIICKGLIIDNDQKLYAFPTFVFDHD